MSHAKVMAFFTEQGLQDRIRVLDRSTATVELAAQAIGCQPSQIAKTLSELKNTRCLFGISGDSQFFWHVLCNDLSDLWKLITEDLGNFEGIQSCNTNMVTLALKRAGFMRKISSAQLFSSLE